MPDDVDAPESDDVLTPDAVENHTFHTAFRGFDPVEVRAFLSRVADALRAAEEAAVAPAQNGSQVSAVDAPAAAADEGATPTADPQAIVAAAVAEAEEVLRDARQRARGMEEEAVAEGRRIVEAARAEAEAALDRARSEAEAELRSAKSKARAEVGREATRLRAEAEQAAAEARVDAERHAAKLKQQAEQEAAAVIEAARERGREMVVEAQAARERMLTDLARRKRAAQAQIEQLRAGRDRMLEALKSARRSVDEVTLRFDAVEGGETSRRERAGGDERAPAADAGPGGADAAKPDAEPEVAPPTPEPAPSLPSLPEPADPTSEGVRIIGTRPTIDAPQAAQVSGAGAARGGDTARSASPEQSSPRARREADDREERKPERRSSALRILRRSRAADREDNQPDHEAAGPPQPAGEGVRILAPTAHEAEAGEAAPPPAPLSEVPLPSEGSPEQAVPGELPPDEVPSDEVPAEEVPSDDVASDDVASEVERSEDEPSPDERPEEPRPDGDGDAAGDQGVATALGAGSASGEEPAPPAVDDIFARIRAEREAATAAARRVLDDEASGPASTEALPPSDADHHDPVVQGVAAAADDAGQRAAGGQPAAVDGGDQPAMQVSDADEAALQHRDAALAELEESLTRRLKRTLQDEQNAALDRLRTHRGSLQAGQLLGTIDEQAAPYLDVARSHLDPAARAGAASSPMGTAAVSVDDLASQLAVDMAGSLRQRLDRALEQAAQEELELSGVAERVNAVYREWKTQRIDRMTAHYANAAYNRGFFLASPEGAPLRWLVDDDGPCPDCDDNALSGPTARGEAYPTGQLLPPAHVGCRCLLVRATA